MGDATVLYRILGKKKRLTMRQPIFLLSFGRPCTISLYDKQFRRADTNQPAKSRGAPPPRPANRSKRSHAPPPLSSADTRCTVKAEIMEVNLSYSCRGRNSEKPLF